MAHFKKMRLIPEDEYERFKANEIKDYSPELMQKVRSEKYLESIISNSTLSPEEKVRMIQANVFVNKSEMKFEPPPTPAPGILPQFVIREEDEDDDDKFENLEDAVRYLPEQARVRASKLKEFIRLHPDISVNDNNELVLNNQVILGSNMTDLFNHLFNPRKTIAPRGLKEFQSKLLELNVPLGFISNRKVVQDLKSHLYPTQNGKGLLAFASHSNPIKPHSKLKRTPRFPKTLGLFKL